MAFVGLTGSNSSSGSGLGKSGLAANLNYCLLFFLFFFSMKEDLVTTPSMLVWCLCNLSARTSSPHLIQLHKNSLAELFGDEIGKKKSQGTLHALFYISTRATPPIWWRAGSVTSAQPTQRDPLGKCWCREISGCFMEFPLLWHQNSH